MLGSQEQDESNDLGCNWNLGSQRLFSSPGINFNPQLYRQEEPEGTSPSPTPSPAPSNLIPVHSQGFNSGPCASLLCFCFCLLGHTCTFESFLGIHQRIRDLNAGIITLNFAIAMMSCLTQNSNKKQNTSVGGDVKILKPLHSVVKMQNDYHYEKQYEDSSKY